MTISELPPLPPAIDELTSPAVRGREYLVPYIKLNVAGFLSYRHGVNFLQVLQHLGVEISLLSNLPILATPHNDKDFFPHVPYDHYHIDFRFVTKQMWTYIGLTSGYKKIDSDAIANSMSIIVPLEVVESEPCYLPAKMIRHFQDMAIRPLESKTEGYRNLQDHYRASQLIDCRICPHRGFNLDAVKANKHGQKVCPGHGLTWDTNGDMVYRTRP